MAHQLTSGGEEEAAAKRMVATPGSEEVPNAGEGRLELRDGGGAAAWERGGGGLREIKRGGNASVSRLGEEKKTGDSRLEEEDEPMTGPAGRRNGLCPRERKERLGRGGCSPRGRDALEGEGEGEKGREEDFGSEMAQRERENYF
uniref:Uncharacterized protein K0413C07.30 n=1 Tax=Oryza sativa subsp. indica TaxID=39946 RepID=C8TFN9_ORYSI|nr:hypothetical protein [Oryza sativa Indica Group]